MDFKEEIELAEEEISHIKDIDLLAETIFHITPEGVDGHGPLYERVYQVAEPWLRERGIIE